MSSEGGQQQKQEGEQKRGDGKKNEGAQKGNAQKGGGQKSGGGGGKKAAGGSSAPVPLPAFIDERQKLWETVKQQYDVELQKKIDAAEKITVTLPDGKAIDGIAWKTTPMEIAKGISRGLADSVVVAKVDGEYHDLLRPLEKSCNLQLFKFDSDEGKHCFWHSSAHILGQALEKKFAAHLTVGPALEEGFYYDSDIPGENKIITPEDMGDLNTFANNIIKEKQNFERLPIPRDVALKMFAYNPYKVELISKIPEHETVSMYKCGGLIDLCRGPHVANTGIIKAFTTTKFSGAYWMGKAENPVLQRVYGIAFPDKKQLTEWEEFQKEAAKRDHRNVGKDQELFFFHPYSPGSCFFLPHGVRIYNKLIGFIKAEYHKRGFTEVMTPNMFNKQLWETSGHWANYKDDMFAFECDKTEFALKPMNCPSHCLMFAHRHRSYRELPLRFADFGVLHRNELAGALTGLTRVRRFQQDDAHIFAQLDQVEGEIQGCLEFMQYVYGIFGFEFTLGLSTRPEKSLGTAEQWEKAEKALQGALEKFGKPFHINHGDGAFYGPKIDIRIMDALKRYHQCATIQLDFQLPIRFNLEYQGNQEEAQRPVMIHRAILGSVERMMAILIEHTGGKWPFWLSPRQCIVLPVAEKHNEYATKVLQQLHDAGYYVDIDASDRKIPKKVREAQLAQYNYILVVGEEEVTAATVNIRTRDNVQHGQKSVQDLLAEFASLTKEFK